MELMFIWKVIIIFLPVVNKPRKGTQKYYFRPEIAVRLEFIYINSFILIFCWVNLNSGDHDQGENIADNGGSKVKCLCNLVQNLNTGVSVHKANSVPGSVQSLQEAAGC